MTSSSGASCIRGINYKNHFYCSCTESEQTQLLFMPVVFSWDINKHRDLLAIYSVGVRDKK